MNYTIWISDDERVNRYPQGAEFLWQGTIADPQQCTQSFSASKTLRELSQTTNPPDVLLIHAQDEKARNIVERAREKGQIPHIMVFTGGSKGDLPPWVHLYDDIRKLYGMDWRKQLRQEICTQNIHNVAPQEKCYVWQKDGKCVEEISVKQVLQQFFVMDIQGLEVHVPLHGESIEAVCYELVKLRQGIADNLQKQNGRVHPLRPIFPIIIVIEGHEATVMQNYASYCKLNEFATLWLSPGFEIINQAEIDNINLDLLQQIQPAPDEELTGISPHILKRLFIQLFADGVHSMANMIGPPRLLQVGKACNSISEETYNRVVNAIRQKTALQNADKRLFVKLLTATAEPPFRAKEIANWPKKIRLLLIDDEWESQCWGELLASLLGFEKRRTEQLQISEQLPTITLEIFSSGANYLVCADPRSWPKSSPQRVVLLQKLLQRYSKLDAILLDLRCRGEKPAIAITQTEGCKILESLRDDQKACYRRSLPIIIFSATNKSITVNQLNRLGIDGQFCKRPPDLQSGLNSDIEWFQGLHQLLIQTLKYRSLQNLEKTFLKVRDKISSNFATEDIGKRVIERIRQIIDEMADIMRKGALISHYYSRYQNPVIMSHQIMYDIQYQLLQQKTITAKADNILTDILGNWFTGHDKHLYQLNKIRNAVVHKSKVAEELESLYCFQVALCLAAKDFSLLQIQNP